MSTSRLLVVGTTIVLATGLSACGHGKTGSTSSVSGAKASATAASTSASASRSGSNGTKLCTTKATQAMIGGKSKCIEAGQECSHKHAADYKQYGFVCEAKGNRYILRKA